MKRKKSVKLRGSKTHGWGSKKKHRGAGSRGGKGKAGTFDHRKSMLWKAGLEHGKRGFTTLKGMGLKKSSCPVNVRDLERLSEGKKELNLLELGYDKVLGSGSLKRPLRVRARSFSASAREKIEKAGGKVIEA